MNIPEIVGRRVRQARMDNGISQADLGRRLGVLLGKPLFPQAVSEAERGGRNFTAEELLALARVLDRPVAWFFFPPEGEDLEFSSGEVLSLVEMSDGPLLAGPYGNAGAAMVQEAMAIVDALEQVRTEMRGRAEGLLRVARLMAKEEGRR
jgi:transcriptional regulator with XRE-family HTH domain